MQNATRCFSLVLFLALGGLIASPALAQDNLIAYGDFESFTTGEKAPSEIFATFNGGADFATYAIVDTEAVSGSQSLSVQYNGGATNFYDVQNFQRSPVTPGAEYTFSFQAKTGATDGSASIAYAVNANTFSPNIAVVYEAAVTSEWQEYEITFTVPEGVTAASGILQFGYANNEDGPIYIDDLSMVKISDPVDPLAPVVVEAESGTLGSEFATGTEGDVTYAYPTTDFSTGTGGAAIPQTDARTASYQVTFPAAGSYAMYARIYVGPGGANDDSFLLGNGAGDKDPTVAADWTVVNQLANGGFTNPETVVEGMGTVNTNQVWKWVRVSAFPNNPPDALITVAGGDLTQTLEIGGREDGLWFDKLAFGRTDVAYTVSNLDNAEVGTLIVPEPGEDGDYQASLSGANEPTPVDTPAMGSAIVTVDGTTVTVEGSFSGLSSTYAASHIHRGAAGVNGPVEITLSAVVSEDTSGVWNAAANTFTVTQALADSIKSGLAYINVHSADNPGGEIRGQIVSTDGNGSLIVTGIFDGPLTGGTPKVVELYVLEDIEDLSRYAIGSANNGGGSDGAEFTFPEGSASAGDFISIATEIDGFTSYFGEAPDYITEAAGINGDDAIEVFFDADDNDAFAGGEVIDVFGDINVDGSGEAWDHLDGWAYRVNGTGPDGSMFVLDNWTFSGVDANDDQTSNATATTPFPYQMYMTAPDLSTIAEARMAGPGETVTVEGTVTRTAGAFTYIQDATGGLAIRQPNDDEDADDFFDNVADGTIAPGTMLRVTGTLSEFRQLLQLNESDLVSYEILGDGDVPDPQSVTLAELAANGENYEGELVTVNSVSFTDTGSFMAATSYQVTDDSDATNAVVVRVPNADDTTVDDTPIPARANITAIVGQFDFDSPTAGYQLLLLDADDVANNVASEGDGEAEMSLAVANPVSHSVTVRFALDAPAEAALTLYDALGRKVATLAEGEMTVGAHTALLDATSLASGVYVLRLQAGDRMMTRTVTVVR